MAIAGKRIPLYLLVIPGLLILTVLVSLSGAVIDSPERSVNVLTENDFAEDPGLFAVPDNEIVAIFLESPLSSDEPNDTGEIGIDVIPYKYDAAFKQTFCWEDGNETAEHFMTLIDVNGEEVVTVNAGGECVTETIAEGEYELHVTHDGNSERRVAVFIVPEGDRSLLTTATEEALENVTSVLNTDKCVGCDLSDVNLNSADLSDVDLSKAILNNAILVDADLSGADLSGAQLVNADLSRANLKGANLSGADLTSAILINADLTDADLTLANLENADTQGAKFSVAQTTGTFAAGTKATSGEENQTDDTVSTRATTCSGDLPAGGTGEDLAVTGGTCKVKAGTYNYGNVNIYSGGTLEFVDEGGETHFWAKSILVESGGEMSAGFDRETGTIKPFGDNGGVLTIHLYGSESDKAGIGCITTDCGITAKINVLNGDNPASCDKSTFNGVTDCFYEYKEPDPETGETGKFGLKVLAVSFGGTLKLFGKKGATYGRTLEKWDSGMSWVRLRNDRDAKPDKTIISLDREVDWDAGDRIVITTTDYLPGHSEELQIIKKEGPRKLRVTIIDPITNMPPDGCTSPPLDNDKCGLRYLHNGDLYPDENFNFKSTEFKRLNLDIEIRDGGADNGKNLAETRAAVALLTRSIRIVSGGDGIGDDFGPPTPGKYYGGQTMIRQGFQEVKIQGVEFYQLGQGGRKGRYPAHFHLARKTPVGTYIKDSSVHDSMTRCYTLHGTHDVTLARNVGYKSIGHCYYIEDGTEIENEFYSNIGIFARAAIKNEQNPREVPGILARGKEIEADVPFNSDIANPAVFWITNGWNDFEYNMAAGAGACGACYWLIPTGISGPSQKMKWEGYASIQQIPLPKPPAMFPPIGPNGSAPLKKFRGNYCSTAQFSFNTVGATDACQGLRELSPAINEKAPAPPPQTTRDRIIIQG